MKKLKIYKRNYETISKISIIKIYNKLLIKLIKITNNNCVNYQALKIYSLIIKLFQIKLVNYLIKLIK